VLTEFLPYEGWLALAKELIHFGHFTKARVFLLECKRHTSYLNNLE
jgi:hypothetical protein